MVASSFRRFLQRDVIVFHSLNVLLVDIPARKLHIYRLFYLHGALRPLLGATDRILNRAFSAIFAATSRSTFFVEFLYINDFSQVTVERAEFLDRFAWSCSHLTRDERIRVVQRDSTWYFPLYDLAAALFRDSDRYGIDIHILHFICTWRGDLPFSKTLINFDGHWSHIIGHINRIETLLNLFAIRCLLSMQHLGWVRIPISVSLMRGAFLLCDVRFSPTIFIQRHYLDAVGILLVDNLILFQLRVNGYLRVFTTSDFLPGYIILVLVTKQAQSVSIRGRLLGHDSL